jgi:transketolase
MQHRQLPDGWNAEIPEFPADPKGLATRDSSGKVLNAVARNVTWLSWEGPRTWRHRPRRC